MSITKLSIYIRRVLSIRWIASQCKFIWHNATI